MKILLCHNFYRQPGGERRAVEQHEKMLRDRGHDVARLTRDSREIGSWGLVDKLRFPATAVWSRRTEREVREVVHRERPDIAHVHNVFPLLSPSLYRTLADEDVPIVQTVHNYRFLCPNGLFFTQGEVCERCRQGHTLHAIRWRCLHGKRSISAVYAASVGLHRLGNTFERIDRFLAPTDFVADKLIEGGLTKRERIEVIPHFLPAPLPEIGMLAREDPYVLYLGRLSHEKGVDLLVEAIGSLPDARLLVAGEGPQRKSLERLAGGRASGRVRFLGHVSGERKRRLLAQAEVLVVPSRCYETFGLSVVEALASGVPVVVAGHGGLASVVEHRRHGLWFRPGDPADLRKRLSEILGDPTLRRRLGAQGRRHVEQRYTEDVAYDRLLAVYQELIR